MEGSSLYFKANANRSVCVFGEITEETVSKLAENVLRLRLDGNNNPITVYINSLGGNVRCAEYIYDILHSKTDGIKSPRIITVALGNAASAAATLLALGDYAIAYPKSSIHFHGVRFGQAVDVTAEDAASMVAQLEIKNRATASMLAEAATRRLAFHYARLKNSFEQIKVNLENSGLSEIECFANSLKDNLSAYGRKIVDKATNRYKSLTELTLMLNLETHSEKEGLNFEASIFKEVIDYEVKNAKIGNMQLDGAGLSRVVNDYLLIRDYFTGDHHQSANAIFANFKHAFFSKTEIDEIQSEKDDELRNKNVLNLKLKTILPFCYFTHSILQGLQEGENPLNPEDAYWLGAVDEVYDTGLPSLRDIAEVHDPQQEDLATSSTSQQPPSSQS